MKLRLDQILSDRKLCQTRSQAAQLIREGKVKIKGRQTFKPGGKFDKNVEISLEDTEQYVGRGAKKLKAAIQNFKIAPKGLIIADVGASTGGFTDYLLQNGSLKSYCIDVGHDQLAEKLKKDPRVINLEGINIRNLEGLPEKVDLAVVDLAYISLRKVLKVVFNLLKPEGKVIVLFKPQFECGPGVVNSQGVITNDEIRSEVLNGFLDWCSQEDYTVIDKIESPITGQNGNQEYLLLLKN